MQATGVVIGFVIVAGVFLGVADYVAGKSSISSSTVDVG